MTRITRQVIADVRRELGRGVARKIIAEALGISRSAVDYIANGKKTEIGVWEKRRIAKQLAKQNQVVEQLPRPNPLGVAFVRCKYCGGMIQANVPCLLCTRRRQAGKE